MKITYLKHFYAVGSIYTRFYIALLSGFAVFGLFMIFFGSFGQSVNIRFSLSGHTTTMPFIFLIPIIFMMPLPFQNRPLWNNGTLNMVEFEFTQAISRKALFIANLTLFWFPVLLYSGGILWGAYSKPLIRLELPYYPQAYQEEAKVFYLSHFKSATLQKDATDKQGNKYYAVLPHARIAIAAWNIAFVLTVMLIYQFLSSLNQKRTYQICLIVFIYIMFIMWTTPLWELLLHHNGKIPFFDQGVAWLASHPTLIFGSLIVLATGVGIFCFHRFNQMEVL